MRDAFKAVKRNRGAAGVDKVSIQMYQANLMDNLHALMRELKDGSFEPLPGSPISTGLFLVRRESTWIQRRISASRSDNRIKLEMRTGLPEDDAAHSLTERVAR